MFQSVMSKIVFVESFLDAQCGSIHMRRVRQCDPGNGGSIIVTSEFRLAVENSLKYLASAPPQVYFAYTGHAAYSGVIL